MREFKELKKNELKKITGGQALQFIFDGIVDFVKDVLKKD